jgi:hypothetical protein
MRLCYSRFYRSGVCFLAEQAAERMKRKTNRQPDRLPTAPRHKTMVEEGLREESKRTLRDFVAKHPTGPADRRSFFA